MRGIATLAPWFGGNRMLAPTVGEELEGCSWVGVPFAGGMAELPWITARTILANDLHRHVINLARVVRDDGLRQRLMRSLRRVAFHPDELAAAQQFCRTVQPTEPPDFGCAFNYFLCCWLGRSGKAGIDDEFNGRPSVRWKSDGGDSMVRFQSAVRALVGFARTLRRCTFETMDAFDFLARCEDIGGHGLYCDPPFPGAGRRYRHSAGQTDAEERTWHTRLRDQLARFGSVRVVCRFYDHPLIRELYPEAKWHWRRLKGRTQANQEAPEVLLINGDPYGAAGGGLF
jgi:DNA adenine methylase